MNYTTCHGQTDEAEHYVPHYEHGTKDPPRNTQQDPNDKDCTPTSNTLPVKSSIIPPRKLGIQPKQCKSVGYWRWQRTRSTRYQGRSLNTSIKGGNWGHTLREATRRRRANVVEPQKCNDPRKEPNTITTSETTQRLESPGDGKLSRRVRGELETACLDCIIPSDIRYIVLLHLLASSHLWRRISTYSLPVNSFSLVHVFIFTFISFLAYWSISWFNNLCKLYVLYDYKSIKPILIYRLFIFWRVFNRQYTHFLWQK